ncbi:hypothetical protein chiPu_0022250 [Chiloscyllium punctatum]|uniref:Uncharacterized protein n=1 Tax=Chiloscyllium punctatum TaxID=137246 RepID=A0A401RFY1_CHIPU|nr:hypothetical protein [Chiloscyllium punctatum]
MGRYHSRTHTLCRQLWPRTPRSLCASSSHREPTLWSDSFFLADRRSRAGEDALAQGLRSNRPDRDTDREPLGRLRINMAPRCPPFPACIPFAVSGFGSSFPRPLGARRNLASPGSETPTPRDVR